MEVDLRKTTLWREVEEHFTQLHAPAFGSISGALDPCASPDGDRIAFTGQVREKLEGRVQRRICVVDVDTGSLRSVTGGRGDERLPKWCPDGRSLAFLSDRTERGCHQLYVLAKESLGEAIAAPVVDGVVEYFWWSPDGSRLLLAVAGRGADLAGGQGSGTTPTRQEDLPTWMPSIEGGVSEEAWRSLFVYDPATKQLQQVSPAGLNVWEAVWCGDDHIAAIASKDPGERAWYDAWLALLDLVTGDHDVIYTTDRQLGCLSSSFSGAKIAVVDALCSDRGIVAGNVLVVDVSTRDATEIDTLSVDVTQLLWRDDQTLFYMGVRGLDTVAGEIDLAEGKASESWVASETCGHHYPQGSPLAGRAFAVVRDSYTRYPEIAIVSDGVARTVHSLDHDGGTYLRRVSGSAEEVSWRASDGLEIQALLCRPDSPPPYPLILHVHGGPVWAYRNKWQLFYPWVPVLVSRGYAVLHVNPRGSSGRGRAFAEAVYGDPGGADADDLLSGLDALVDRGLADPDRIGVTGGSYGGFLSCWLVTQSDRFAAAVAVAPVSDWCSQHFTSNLQRYRRFLEADPSIADGRFFHRSPVMFASRVQTPTLLVAGAHDRCTPPGQAIEFHRALREHGVDSEVVVYPEEGHGVRSFPAVIDFHVRMIDWFERHMSPS